MSNANSNRLDIFRTLVDGLRAIVNPSDHHRAYVRECIETNDLDALGELDGALALANELGDTQARIVLGGLRGTIGHAGKFPAGVWDVIVTEMTFGYVNNYYTKLAETERACTCLDWGTFLR